MSVMSSAGRSSNPDAIRRLVAEFRHDLRTPINAILGYTELLQEEWIDAGHGASMLESLAELRQVGRLWLRQVNESLSDDRVSHLEHAELKILAEDLQDRLTPEPAEAARLVGNLLESVVADRPGDAEDLGRIGTAIIDFRDRLNRPPTAAPVPLASPDNPIIPEALCKLVQDELPQHSPVMKLPYAAEPSRLLIVDDQEANRDLLARRLQRLGHTTVTAADGHAALAILRTPGEQFDLLLLDVMMPGMSGVEVLRTVKADASLAKLPVVMVSALDEIASVAGCIEQGAEDYLPKPCDPVLLEARVNACLEQKRLRDAEAKHREQIELERKRHEELLHVLLPARIVEELKHTGTVRPRRYEDVAVLFADIVGFTAYCDRHPPESVVRDLQSLVADYESLSGMYGLQKIKTIGDCYMAVAGLLDPVADPVAACVRCGLAMIEATKAHQARWQVRVGIHQGPVVAGILGHRQYLFDIWGDTVNMAARTEHHGQVNAVTLSGAAWSKVADIADATQLPAVELKGKGAQTLYRFDRFK